MALVLQMFAVIIAVAALLPTPTSTHDTHDIKFAVTVSSRLKGGDQETLCVQIPKPSEHICLTVQLEMPSGNQKDIILEKAVYHNFFRCFKFKVPKVTTRTVANISVIIESEDDSVDITKKSKVLIEPPTFIHIIRSDKPIYTPGQNVMFRIVSMDTNFIPVKREYKVVELLDPNLNRIAQWQDRFINGGILDLSHQLIPEAEEGTYRIAASTNKEEKIFHYFKVEKFVLPKYEVKLHLPKVFTVYEKDITFKICGKYTYGKPVNGSVQAVFCRRGYSYSYYWHRRETAICQTYNLQTDRSGCATQTVNITAFITSNYVVTYFEVTAEMKESGTGVILSESGRINVRNIMRRVNFEDVPVAYKHGLLLEGKIKLIGADDNPVPNGEVYLYGPFSDRVTLITDSRGIAKFSVDTMKWKNTITLRGLPKMVSGTYPSVPYNMRPRVYARSHRVIEFYSKSKSFVKLMQVDDEISCDTGATLHAQYIIQGKELKLSQDSLNFFYLVTSRGEFRQQGKITTNAKYGTVNTGKFSITVEPDTNLAPFIQVAVYTVLESGEVVADSMDYPIQLCLKNKVSLKFSSPQQLPASQTKLHLKAEPGSLCSLRAIDLSVLLLEQEQDLTVDYMYRQLPVQKLSGYSYQVEDNEPYPCWPDGDPQLPISSLGLSYYPQRYERNDAYSTFKEIGVKMVTNMRVKKPQECRVILPTPAPQIFWGPGTNNDFFTTMMATFATERTFTTTMPTTASAAFTMTNIAQLPQPTTRGVTVKQEIVRKLFPETWIWDLVPVGNDGSADVVKKVPDTITKWVAGAFCVSPVGFGVSPNTGLTTLKPFFVSLTLPYSVIRGETFTLRASVFNYLSDCIVVKVTLASSDQYAYNKCVGCQYTVCLCGEESATFTWTVTPSALGQVDLRVSAEAETDDALCGNKPTATLEYGRIDTVVRKLLVEAEGTPQTVSHNALLCPANKTVQEKISLVLPKLFVEGSPKASVSVVGDVMGRALKNIEKLVRMPYGCGEQNMLSLAPNIFVLNYLKSSNQLTTEILNRGQRNMRAGYQRELRYKHYDGSYSAFGKRDRSGNTWLTAFVMKTFNGAKPYIYVDNKHIEEAKRWLSTIQGPDGCIRSVGRLFNSRMRGGVRDEVTLTAYVTAALLEIDDDVTEAVVLNGLNCLRNASAGTVDNVYTKALLFYTFTLAKDQQMRLKLMQDLHSKSSTEGGARHWDVPGAPRYHLDPLAVETTSYVLLALLSGPNLPNFKIGYSAGIQRWLVRQQNPYGGFSSTQDTVVALQALAKYSAAISNEEGSTKVKVKSKSEDIKFTVNEKNKLLYQEEMLSEVPGEYKVKAKGQMCVLVQISLTYNIPPPPDFSSFNISVNTHVDCRLSKPQVSLYVQVRYNGPRDETNMVILDIKLLSGYSLAKASLKWLQKVDPVRRLEEENGHIILYLDELKKDVFQTFFLNLEQEEAISNLKPAVVRIYDYYQTSDEAASNYNFPCASP